MAKQNDQAEAQKRFFARLEKQRAEREKQVRQAKRPRTFIPAEEDQPKRNWADVIDQHGRIRHW
jgi:hypothetical protein